MARRALIEREKRRADISARLFNRRYELKQIIAAPATDPDARADAVRRLAALPRDSSPARRRNRDMVDGRPRGVLSRFGLPGSGSVRWPTTAGCPAFARRRGE
jgi:small subunit ribosomal protein S14